MEVSRCTQNQAKGTAVTIYLPALEAKEEVEAQEKTCLDWPGVMVTRMRPERGGGTKFYGYWTSLMVYTLSRI